MLRRQGRRAAARRAARQAAEEEAAKKAAEKAAAARRAHLTSLNDKIPQKDSSFHFSNPRLAYLNDTSMHTRAPVCCSSWQRQKTEEHRK